MQPDMDALLGRWAPLGRKVTRYSLVSGISIAITLALMIAFEGGLEWRAHLHT